MGTFKIVAALALATTVAADGAPAASGISAVCENDNTISVSINYSNRAKILELSYGDCNLTSSGVSGDTGTSSNGWNLTFDISRCGMDSNLRTLHYNHTATVLVGREISGFGQIKLADFSIDTYCSYTAEHTVIFNYDAQRSNYSYSSSSVSPTGSDPFSDATWKVATYNSDFTQEQEMPSQGGKMIYLGFSVNSTGFSNWTSNGAKIAPKNCEVRTTDGSKSYTLFDTTKEICSNDFIELETNLYTNGGFQMYQVQYRLFMIGMSSVGNYELSCSMLICGSAAATECKAALDCLLAGSGGN